MPMGKLWRLMTAIFMIVAAVGLFLLGWIFSGGLFNNMLSVIIAYVVMGLVLFGITKGLLVIIDYHRENKE